MSALSKVFGFIGSLISGAYKLIKGLIGLAVIGFGGYVVFQLAVLSHEEDQRT
jgi:hypothetical protein